MRGVLSKSLNDLFNTLYNPLLEKFKLVEIRYVLPIVQLFPIDFKLYKTVFCSDWVVYEV